MGKRGPAPKAPEEARRHNIGCKLNDEELARLQAGKPEGLALGVWLRQRALARRLPRAVPAVNREAWAQFGRIAGGLSTLARAAAEGRIVDIPADVIEGLRHELAGLRRLLLGQGLEGGDAE